jgi:CubicO group peptidase (beta-lactamase class C family)
MRGILAALAALTLALTGCTSDIDTPEREPSPVSTASDAAPQCEPDLDQAFNAWSAAGFSGSIAIAERGEFHCLAAYGPANQETGAPNTGETVFGIGSVSKSFTAAAILSLVDAGTVSLDDRAGDYIAELSGPAAHATIGQLLLHTSGLTGSHGTDHQPLDHDDALAAISRLELAFEPGTDYAYSNSGYTLLALVVEELAETGYRDYLASEILTLPDGEQAGGFWDGEPTASGPRAVGYDDDGPTDQLGDFAGPHWALDGNGDLAMTMEQLAAWTHALFTGDVLSPESTALISTPGFDHGDGASETPGWAMYDDALLGEAFLGSAGGGGDTGHNAVVVWLPESERVVAVASNTAEITAEELLQAVGPSLIAGEPLPTPDVPAGDVDPTEMSAAEGRYELESGDSFDVTASDNGLDVAASGPDAMSALFAVPDGYTDDDVARHEEHVRALLEGDTREGQEERAALESDVGAIDNIQVDGTIVDDGELRTYVTVTSPAGPTTLWYALDQHGAIAGVDGPVDPPSVVLIPTEDGGFRPADPVGSGSEISVEFDDRRMSISGPSGVVTADLAD